MELRDLGKDGTVERSSLFGASGGEGGEEGLNWVDVYHLCSDIFFLFCVLRVFVRRFGIHDLLFMLWPKR